ncbi:hypothetical protein [Chondrinema litorale]|uniref:hypothetical protein n=1 Tax=Chondrinema litorale TaxID=2994555 RepID=UPI0025439756|nr:hypothetical protein [Chondrinema litorale]UZR99006.1 hypothetical protein OQ292_33960 [Chondrinema litorale]
MEALYTNEIFKNILFYVSVLIYLFIIAVVAIKLLAKKQIINKSSVKASSISNDDVKRIFAFTSSLNSEKEKKELPFKKESDYNMENNFFKEGNHDLGI